MLCWCVGTVAVPPSARSHSCLCCSAHSTVSLSFQVSNDRIREKRQPTSLHKHATAITRCATAPRSSSAEWVCRCTQSAAAQNTAAAEALADQRLEGDWRCQSHTPPLSDKEAVERRSSEQRSGLGSALRSNTTLAANQLLC